MRRLSSVLGIVMLTLALSPRTSNAQAGQILYVADGAEGQAGHLFKVDPTNTLSFTDIGPIQNLTETGIPITGLAFQPGTGVLYAVSSGGGSIGRRLYTINTTNANATLIGSLGGFPVADITFSSTGILYGWEKTGGKTSRGALARKPLGGASDGLVTINLLTGAATPVGSFALSNSSGSGIAFALGTLYLSVDDSDGALRTVNPATGVTTVGPTMNGDGDSIGALSADPAGALYGVVTGNTLIRIDKATGAVTDSGGLPSAAGGEIDAIAFQGSAIGPGGASLVNVPALGRYGLLVLAGMLAVAGLLLARIR